MIYKLLQIKSIEIFRILSFDNVEVIFVFLIVHAFLEKADLLINLVVLISEVAKPILGFFTDFQNNSWVLVGAQEYNQVKNLQHFLDLV